MKPFVIQFSSDGFGHQLEGILGIIALHFSGKVNYDFNYKQYELKDGSKFWAKDDEASKDYIKFVEERNAKK